MMLNFYLHTNRSTVTPAKAGVPFGRLPDETKWDARLRGHDGVLTCA